MQSTAASASLPCGHGLDTQAPILTVTARRGARSVLAGGRPDVRVSEGGTEGPTGTLSFCTAAFWARALGAQGHQPGAGMELSTGRCPNFSEQPPSWGSLSHFLIGV